MDAQNDCVLFNRMRISILVAGATHPCGDFKVEKRAPKAMVVVCEGTFTVQPRPLQARESRTKRKRLLGARYLKTAA